MSTGEVSSRDEMYLQSFDDFGDQGLSPAGQIKIDQINARPRPEGMISNEALKEWESEFMSRWQEAAAVNDGISPTPEKVAELFESTPPAVRERQAWDFQQQVAIVEIMIDEGLV